MRKFETFRRAAKVYAAPCVDLIVDNYTPFEWHIKSLVYECGTMHEFEEMKALIVREMKGHKGRGLFGRGCALFALRNPIDVSGRPIEVIELLAPLHEGVSTGRFTRLKIAPSNVELEWFVSLLKDMGLDVKQIEGKKPTNWEASIGDHVVWMTKREMKKPAKDEASIVPPIVILPIKIIKVR